MGFFSSDECESCGATINTGMKSKHCGHWVCSNCIVQRSTRTSHMFGKDTMLCVVCGDDTGVHHDAIIERMRTGG
ncbi:MAG: hypothetical protein R8K22_03920 [Mariprofundaceae bacterium]